MVTPSNIIRLRMELARIGAAVKPIPGSEKHMESIAVMDAKLVAAQKKVTLIQQKIRKHL